MRPGFFKKFQKRGRKYPMKRDESGKSARRRAFALFDKGLRPAEVTSSVGISTRTACRYYQSWKKLGERFENRYRAFRILCKRNPEFREGLIWSVADILNVPIDKVRAQFQAPWGLKGILMGKWRDRDQVATDQEEQQREWVRLQSALTMIHLLEVDGVGPETLKATLDARSDRPSSLQIAPRVYVEEA